MGVTTVLFDLDGTLTDSRTGIVASYRHALATFGLSAGDDSITAWIGPPLQDGFAALGVPVEEVPTAIERYREYFSETGILQNRLYDGIPEMLDRLDGAGLTLGLATSKLGEFAERILDRFGIAGHFDVVAGSSRDGSRISKADVVGSALQTLGHPTGVVLVGDRSDDMQAARKFGLCPVGAAWGYGSRSELESSGSEIIVEHPLDIPRALGL